MRVEINLGSAEELDEKKNIYFIQKIQWTSKIIFRIGVYFEVWPVTQI